MKPALLILAAGMGSRYGGLKQIDPIGPHNEVIIDYSIYDAIKAGFDKVVFVIRRDIEKDFKEFFGSKFEKYITVEYVYQELTAIPFGVSVLQTRTKPWGTAHAILMAKDVIHTPFAVINADDFYGKESFVAMYEFLTTAAAQDVYSLVGYQLKNTISPYGSVNRGVCHQKDGNLTDIIETKNIQTVNEDLGFYDNELWKSLDPDVLVSMNFFGFSPSLFSYLEEGFADFLSHYGQEEKSEYYITTLIDELIKDKKVLLKVIPNSASWFGVTYKEDKPHVVDSIQQLIAQGVYPDKLWN